MEASASASREERPFTLASEPGRLQVADVSSVAFPPPEIKKKKQILSVRTLFFRRPWPCVFLFFRLAPPRPICFLCSVPCVRTLYNAQTTKITSVLLFYCYYFFILGLGSRFFDPSFPLALRATLTTVREPVLPYWLGWGKEAMGAGDGGRRLDGDNNKDFLAVTIGCISALALGLFPF